MVGLNHIENCKYRRGIASTCMWHMWNCCPEECVREKMMAEVLYAFDHGSFVYGTYTDKSDMDVVFVVEDKFDDFLSKYEKGIFEYQSTTPGLYFRSADFQYLTKSNYINLIKKNDIMALESLFLPKDNIFIGNILTPLKYREYFDKDNKWAIRQSISATASNSWAKAHKKMTVEKDLDLYKGQKSLFHSLRILMFGNQLCEFGEIKDYSCANEYWTDIYYNMKDAFWEDYKAKYKPVYNSLRSKLAELAPKPIENEKENEN